MTSEQKQALQAKIELKIAETKSRIEELKELTKPVSPDNAIGRISRMDAINNKSVNEAGLRSAKSTLQKLERQVSRVGEENFGHCLRCGNEIRYERLMFMPESTKCITCARKG